jgi:hypothetical protein
MKINSIKRHLKSYSIIKERKTTISHAFASALSIPDEFEISQVSQAIRLLEQNPDYDLFCAYCGKEAETWDHINAIVLNGEFSGNGHQINNLIPCCKTCNSKKGNKNWEEFLRKKNNQSPSVDLEKRIKRINDYIGNNNINLLEIIKNQCPELLKNFQSKKEQVLELLQEADEIATQIRNVVRERL